MANNQNKNTNIMGASVTNPYNSNTTITTSSTVPSNLTINNGTTQTNWAATSGYINIEFDQTDKNVIEFFNFICELIGVDMDYDKFKKLSKNERMEYLRDSKIKEILK